MSTNYHKMFCAVAGVNNVTFQVLPDGTLADLTIARGELQEFKDAREDSILFGTAEAVEYLKNWALEANASFDQWEKAHRK